MSDKQLALKVVFSAVDVFSKKVGHVTEAARAASKALRDNQAGIKDLNKTVDRIDAFKKAGADAAITANVFAKNRREIDALKAAMDKVGVPTKKMSDEMQKLVRKSAELKDKHESLTRTEQDLHEKLKAAGVDMGKLTEERRRLASASADAANATKKLSDALDTENAKSKRMNAARAEWAKYKSTAGKTMAVGAGISAAGVAVGLPIGKSLKDFSSFETAMLGVARQMDGARDDNGKVTKTYWEMADSIKAISERLPGTAKDIAKIVEGGARMGIQGKDNLLTYAETTAIMANAFDLPVDQIGQDIGTISQLYKVPIKDIKQLGDTINWLDDQTLAKGADIIDVMKRIAGTADMVKMSYKEAAALGSTFLSSGATAEVAASASNAMMRELSIATMQSKRFQTGMKMLGLKSDDVQNGMSNNATGTIMMVLEKIKALKPEKQLEATTRLFGKEFGDDAAKLASNLDKYREALRLVNEEKAKGSMDRELSAWQDTLAASTENTRDTFENLSTDLGKFLKEEAVGALKWTMDMVKSIRDWSKENPVLSDSLMTTIKWLSIALLVIGGIVGTCGAVMLPLALLKASMLALGFEGAASMGLLSLAIKGIGLAIKATLIGALVTTLVTGAILVYENWDKVREFFNSMIDGFIGKINRLKENLRYLMPGIFGDIKDAPTRASTTATISSSPMLKQAAAGASYQLNFHTPAGTDTRDLAAQVGRELERIEAKKAARQRGALRDTE